MMPFAAQIDNQTAVVLNATRSEGNVQVTLFYAGGLGVGPHTLRMIPQTTTATSVVMAIDYAVITTFM
jgi:hypothetical protein